MLHRLLALLLLAVAIVASAGPAAAARITNTAQLSWNDGGTPITVNSNPVVTEVATPPRLTVYRPVPGAPIILPVAKTPCLAAGGLVPAGTAALDGDALGVEPTTSVRVGERLIFKVSAPAANLDRAAVETITAILATTGGDRETVVAYETGPDTGDFVGSIATVVRPPVPVQGDCILSLAKDDRILIECKRSGDQAVIASAEVEALLDPYGLIFDSEDGAPVSGTRLTLVNADTGQPARVFAPDGLTSWPASVVTGESVRDGAGVIHPFPAGEYRFPLVAAGRYRFTVAPPAPYSAPSRAGASQLAGLTRPDGGPLELGEGSWGGVFTLAGAAPVRIDIPLDRPPAAITVTKTASTGTAAPGDLVRYVVTARNPDPLHAKRDVALTDVLPAAMRLRSDTIRVDGFAAPAAVTVAADGRQVRVALGTLAPGAVRTVSYALQVRPDAREGQALNRAVATDSRGLQGFASVAVRVTRQVLGERMTVIGRILAAGCDARAPFARGIGGIRVFLEDGSYAVTDQDGRYHFEGLVPGTHVVQVDPATLPAGNRFVNCDRSTRAAGSAISRFVVGQDGSLVDADFHAIADARAGAAALPLQSEAVPTAASDREAAGAERNWFADRTASIAWLFPEEDHNPRAPAVRVAIRHLPGQRVVLFADGKPVDPIALDGTRVDPAGGGFAVTLWRGVPLRGEATLLTAEVHEADGRIAARLTRPVHFAATATRAVFLPDRSRLVADGVSRPVVAVRLVDRAGRPLHAGSVGEIAVSAPYVPAQAIDAEQQRMLAGLERARPTWRVNGDDGVALIELAPTTVSGQLTLDFAFRDGDRSRRQTLDAWLKPGDQPWTIVGLAEGRLGKGTLGRGIEPLATDPGVLADGRIAFYAKGRVLGSVLLTVAYDSAKRRDEQRLGGTIDPNAYYTVYADRSERRFDAASLRKLYVRLETATARALFGDFETGFGDTELGRYQRAANGLKLDWRGRRLAASAFVARTTTRHRREELQGNGLSGPYALLARDIVANSELVVIESRDRLRSERIVERRTLVRFVDYDIDYAAGTLRFTSPVQSRTSALDPQFVVVDYDVDPTARADATNAGARVTWRDGDRARLGATLLSDRGELGRSRLAAVDARVRLAEGTELRAEAAVSNGAAGTATAFQAEVEHHDANADLLAYVRQQDRDFGLGQQNGAERGRRKVGIDGKLRLSERLALAASAWTDRDLTGPASRIAARAQVEYRDGQTQLRAGLSFARDETFSGDRATSTLLEASATRRLFGNRLELEAATSVALDQAASVDFPAAHRLGARFQFSQGVTLVGSYEIAKGAVIDARTARIGFDLKPWAGARLTSAVADQAIGEYGRRAFAAYGLAQSLQLGKSWSIDATLDGNRTIGGIDPGRLVNPLHPVAAGGQLNAGGAITEDFTATTLGATWRAGQWSATGRAERRWGDSGTRTGLQLGAIRQLGDGSTAGGQLVWTQADAGGTRTATLDAAMSVAVRPATAPLAWLGKLDYREDRVTGARAGARGPVGGALLTVDGSARSRRLLASMSADWAPLGRDEGGSYRRSEIGVFLAARYVTERFDDMDLAGVTTLAGIDARIGLGDRLELGVAGTVRGDIGRGSFAYAAGPMVGIRPARNSLLTIGWNISGFADRDFADARATRAGPYASLRLKFDQGDFGWLGIGRR